MRLLADRVWGGNPARMAREVGVSTAAVSRVLSGEQVPSTRLIEALAHRSEINIHWLLTGEGDPLAEAGAGAGRSCPIADHLLPGTPEEYPDRLSGVSFPVAEQ